MTTKEILKALRNNRNVVLGEDIMKVFRLDMFGDLVVVDISGANEPVRKATLSDKRKAEFLIGPKSQLKDMK